jgi:hypothetical protein
MVTSPSTNRYFQAIKKSHSDHTHTHPQREREKEIERERAAEKGFADDN